MAKRSLKASPTGITQAKRAFDRREWTQEYLASAVGLQTRQPIWKFFSGRPIERHLFVDICFQLDLDWEDIADLPQLHDADPKTAVSVLEQTAAGDANPDALQQVRSHVANLIQFQCSTVQNVSDFSSVLSLPQIYTDIYLLPYLSSQRWLDVEDLPLMNISKQSERFSIIHRLNATLEGPLPQKISLLDAIQTHSRLMIVGKPGTGKTVALQHLALQCSEGRLYGDRIPIFISLRDWLSVSTTESFCLAQYLCQQWADCDVSLDQVQTWLKQGKIWLFLDGLDEVEQKRQQLFKHHIQSWVDQYPQLPIVMTCRIGAQDYCFRGFAYMETTDFSEAQIAVFVNKWFTSAAKQGTSTDLTEQFLTQIQNSENQHLRDLAVTPILLNFICLAFQEQGRFPKKLSRLYQHGLDILLAKWDAIRGIHRSPLSPQLSLPELLNILSQVASAMLAQRKYIFEKSEVLTIIAKYLVDRTDAPQDWEMVWSESKAILQAIIANHGLLVERARDFYTFSHFTFQEYLTVRKLFTEALTPPSLGRGKDHQPLFTSTPLKSIRSYGSKERSPEPSRLPNMSLAQ